MQNFLLDFNSTQETDYTLTIFSFFLCFICSYALKYIYEISSTSLTGKSQISKILPLLSVTTFLVILIVKSSLALSLGLVGALSIVRFRTPIKEPEELVYLFIAIAIGLGYGSGQILITLTIFLLISFIIWFFYKNKSNNKELDFNLVIEIPNTKNAFNSGEFVDVLKSNMDNYDIIKYESTKELLSIIIKVNLLDFTKIDQIKDLIIEKYEGASVSFYESKQLF